MPPLTLLRANPAPSGGAEIYLARLSRAFTDHDIPHTIRHSPFPRWLPSWLRALLFSLYARLTKKDQLYFSLERITCADIYRAGDGVHRVFRQSLQKPSLNPLHIVHPYLERLCFTNSTIIIANSRMVKQQIIDTYRIPEEKIKVIYTGIPMWAYDPQSAFARLSKEFTIPRQHKIILYVGSGFARKGAKALLHLLAALKHRNFTAFIVGKERNMPPYRQTANQLKLTDKIIFTGPRDDVVDFYTIADIFILPTYYDPFANAVLEAMSLRTAVFTTKQNGACEILDNHFIMQHPTDLSIAPKIDTLLTNESHLNKIKDENQATAKHYNITNNATQTITLIRQTQSHSLS